MGADQLHRLAFQGFQASGDVAPDTHWMRVVVYVRWVVLEYCWSSCVVWSVNPRRSRASPLLCAVGVDGALQILLRGIRCPCSLASQAPVHLPPVLGS